MEAVSRAIMNGTAVDALRLSWRYARDGQSGLRDLFLTLAVAESGLNEAVWAEQCRRWLGRTRPGHPFGKYPTIGASLADPRFADELERLKNRFPPSRIRWLVEHAESQETPTPADFELGPMRGSSPISSMSVEHMANEITSRCPSWMIRRVSPCDYRRTKAFRHQVAIFPRQTVKRILAVRPFAMKAAPVCETIERC